MKQQHTIKHLTCNGPFTAGGSQLRIPPLWHQQLPWTCNIMMTTTCSMLALLCGTTMQLAHEEDTPDFRGPDGDEKSALGCAVETDIWAPPAVCSVSDCVSASTTAPVFCNTSYMMITSHARYLVSVAHATSEHQQTPTLDTNLHILGVR